MKELFQLKGLNFIQRTCHKSFVNPKLVKKERTPIKIKHATMYYYFLT